MPWSISGATKPGQVSLGEGAEPAQPLHHLFRRQLVVTLAGLRGGVGAVGQGFELGFAGFESRLDCGVGVLGVLYVSEVSGDALGFLKSLGPGSEAGMTPLG